MFCESCAGFGLRARCILDAVEFRRNSGPALLANVNARAPRLSAAHRPDDKHADDRRDDTNGPQLRVGSLE
jgi:hypothetical protein